MQSLPSKPNLEFLQKSAKALRAAHRRGDAACCERIRQGDVSFKSLTDAAILAAPFSINDAQRIVAREYGYSSWAKLKHFIASLDAPQFQGVADKQAYHQTIAASYDQRSPNYDNFVWAREHAQALVDYCPPRAGDAVLDIATGTGTVAFLAAEKVGAQGSVVGIEISKGMLQVCEEKRAASTFNNLRFQYADAEHLDFPPNSFDRIYCSSAFFWMAHPLAALRHWFELLKPGGMLAFNAWPDNSFLWGDGARQALRKHGIQFTVHEVTGNAEKIQQLVELAGYANVRVLEHRKGRYIPVEDAKGPPLDLNSYAPGQYPHPLHNVPEAILRLVQQDYEAEVDKLVTPQGVWHDLSLFYVVGQKL